MRTIALLVGLAGLAGCATARRGLPVADPVRLDRQEEAGRQAFAANCEVCHPHGEGGIGLALNNRPLPGFLIRFQVRNGLGGMPAFDRRTLPADRLDDLVAYVEALRRAEGGTD